MKLPKAPKTPSAVSIKELESRKDGSLPHLFHEFITNPDNPMEERVRALRAFNRYVGIDEHIVDASDVRLYVKAEG